MRAEDEGELDESDDAAAELEALEHEVQLLHTIRDGLASQTETDVMLRAVTGLIEEREAELERSRHST